MRLKIRTPSNCVLHNRLCEERRSHYDMIRLLSVSDGCVGSANDSSAACELGEVVSSGLPAGLLQGILLHEPQLCEHEISRGGQYVAVLSGES